MSSAAAGCMGILARMAVILAVVFFVPLGLFVGTVKVCAFLGIRTRGDDTFLFPMILMAVSIVIGLPLILLFIHLVKDWLGLPKR